jgi:hypothetical protein
MRWIEKGAAPPAPLVEYLTVQIPVGVNLDYDSYPAKRDLRLALTQEQFGLCAFTGVPVDERLSDVESPPETGIKLKSHNAHLKPRTICKDELIAAGKEPGKDLGEDMDYKNIVAALEVQGCKDEMFGAAAAGDWWEPELFVSPTNPDCEKKFHYFHSGKIEGTDPASNKTIEKLCLTHQTLAGWRNKAIFTFINPEIPDHFTAPYLMDVLSAMDPVGKDKLPEFSFVVKHVAQSLLNEMGA